MFVLKYLSGRKQMRLFLIGLFQFLLLSSGAQIFSFDNYPVSDGLVQSNVKCIIQDKKGYIWLGTDGGLSRFDGKVFQNYSVNEGLADNSISALLTDHSGTIWIGHATGGLTLFKEDKFNVMSSVILPGTKKVLCIFEDLKGSVWISYQDFGVVKIIDPVADLNDPHNFFVFRSSDGLSALVFDMLETKNADFYFATDVGVKHLMADGKSFEFLKNKELEGHQTTKMLEDDAGNLWFGLYLGGSGLLARLDKNSGTVTTTFLNSFIANLIKDRNGNLWASTWGSGIIKINCKTNQLTRFGPQNGLNSEKNYCLFNDREGNILIGSQNNGFYIFKGERFVTYNSSGGLAGDQVYAVVPGENSLIWVGTNKGLSAINQNDNTIRNLSKGNEMSIRSMVNDGLGNLWIGTTDQKVIRFNLPTGKFSTPELLNDHFTSSIVNALVIDKSGRLWVGTIGSGLCAWDVKGTDLPKNFTIEDGFFGQLVTINSLLCDHQGTIWISVDGKGIARYSGNKFITLKKQDGFPVTDPTALAEDKQGNIWIGTSGNGLYKYDGKQFRHFTVKEGLTSDLINLITVDQGNTVWAGTNKGLSKFIEKDSLFISYGKNEGFRSIETKANAGYSGNGRFTWFGTVNGLIRYDAAYDQLNTLEALTSIVDVKINYTSSLSLSARAELNYKENTLSFFYSGICISDPDAVRYSVMLEGFESKWRPSTRERSVIYSNLPPGKYIFKVRAENNLGILNKIPVTFTFSIYPPWYFTFWAYLIYVLIGGIWIVVFIKWREGRLKMENLVLEEKVRLRTTEVLDKNRELDTKNKDIMASIRYAKRIQDAILPPDEYVLKYLPKTFIFFKPKDIVSGDFYWLHDAGDKIVFAAVDCTGHGVPGAFMSIVGHNHLEQIVGKQGITQPAAILDALNRSVSETLRQSNTDEHIIKDGMDIAICMFNRKTSELQYAGAYNPLYWVRNSVLNEIKADKFPIGNLQTEEHLGFSNHSLQLEKGDTLYIFSDGFADQFGGADGKKLKSRLFKKLLLEAQHLSMEEQGMYIGKAFEEWKGSLEQVDDILVIGTRL